MIYSSMNNVSEVEYRDMDYLDKRFEDQSVDGTVFELPEKGLKILNNGRDIFTLVLASGEREEVSSITGTHGEEIAYFKRLGYEFIDHSIYGKRSLYLKSLLVEKTIND